jgi:hypothetical protein
MNDRVFELFLTRQYEKAMALVAESDRVELLPMGKSPYRLYIARIRGKGLVKSESGAITESDRCDVGIQFPEGYLRGVDVYRVLTYLGPSPRPFHPNFACGTRVPICVHLPVGAALDDIIYTLYDLWTWNLFSTGDDGLNPEASNWARSQDPSRFPVDRRPLKRTRMKIKTRELSMRKA